jgi:hypothetical protein
LISHFDPKPTFGVPAVTADGETSASPDGALSDVNA